MQTMDPVIPAAPLALTRTAGERTITLHTLDHAGPVKLGTFASSADAWRAIDELDMSAFDGALDLAA